MFSNKRMLQDVTTSHRRRWRNRRRRNRRNRRRLSLCDPCVSSSSPSSTTASDHPRGWEDRDVLRVLHYLQEVGFRGVHMRDRTRKLEHEELGEVEEFMDDAEEVYISFRDAKSRSRAIRKARGFPQRVRAARRPQFQKRRRWFGRWGPRSAPAGARARARKPGSMLRAFPPPEADH